MQNKTPFGSKNYQKVLENEDSEDGYISPQDLSIKDEKIWDPTDEEILSYALKLGYDIEKDPDELFEVAYYYMKYPLPEGWKRGIMKNTKELVYINFLTGEIEVSTEIEEMAHQMYLEKKSEMNQKKVSIFKKTPEKKEITTVVPRKKIPPINNQLQKSNNSTGIKSLPGLPGVKDINAKENNNNDLQFSNKKIESQNDNNRNNLDYLKNEKLINLNNNIDKFLEQSINEKEFKDLLNNKEKNDKKEMKYNTNNNPEKEKEKERELKTNKEENKKQNYDYLLNLGGLDDDEEIEEDEDEEDIITKEDNEEKDDKGEKEDSFLKQMLKREKEIEQLRKEKEKTIENVINKNDNLKNLIDIKKIKCESEGTEDIQRQKDMGTNNMQNIELFKEKKEYLKKKLDELNKYKEEIKVIYEDKKDKYEKEKKEKKNFYDNKLKEELNTNKKKLEKQFKDKLELYEKQLINKKIKEEKRYNDELVNNIKLKKEENKEMKKKKEEKQKEELKQKKNDLLTKIDNIKKLKLMNNTNLSQKKINLQKSTLFIEENKNIEKNNKTKKYEMEIKNIENQLEKEFQQKKQNLSKNISQNISFMSSQFSNTITKDTTYDNNGLNDITKLLNEEYEINCKAFEQELENKKLKEIEKYTNKIIDEKNEQINSLKNEINTVEKDYYKSISNIRNNSFKNKVNIENNLKIKFEQTLNDYEHTKNDILEQNQQLMEYINSNLHNFLISNYSLKQTENKLDEFLLNLKETYLLIYQKNKNSFEMYENDYIFKTQFIKYLLDIVNYINELFISEKINKKNDEKDNNNENGNNNIKNIEQNIADKLLLFCKEKIKEYRKKYKKLKNSSIFKFMNNNLMQSQSFDNSNISNMYELDEINKTILFDISQRKQMLKNNKVNSNHNPNHNNNYNPNKFNNSEINSKNEININNANINTNENNSEITYYIIDQQKNYVVPMLPENILSNLNEDILLLYQDIVLFLKYEYNKIVEINNIIKENKDNKSTKNISTNLNINILDKIKSNTEESFTYLIKNYNKSEQILNIKKRLRLILNHIDDYKNNLNLDKYLTNNKLNKITHNNILDEEKDIVNSLPINKDNIHVNNYINNKEDINNFKNKKKQSVNDINRENEEQKQNGSEVNLSRSIKINSNSSKAMDSINGRFNNFYRQYSSNTLVDTLNNSFMYQFFNYKKNKYELDKSLGKISIP